MKKIMKKDSVIHRTQTISGFKSNGRITQFNRLYLPQGLSGTNTVSKPRDVEANAGSARKTSILSSMRRHSRRGSYSDESDSSHHYHSSESERSIFGHDDSPQGLSSTKIQSASQGTWKLMLVLRGKHQSFLP
jgi:hypothetical protein